MENLSDKLKIDITDKKHNLSHITLPKLLKGKYELIIGKKLRTINVLEENNVDNYNDYYLPIAIEKMVCDNNMLKIKLNKNNKNKSNIKIRIFFI